MEKSIEKLIFVSSGRNIFKKKIKQSKFFNWDQDMVQILLFLLFSPHSYYKHGWQKVHNFENSKWRLHHIERVREASKNSLLLYKIPSLLIITHLFVRVFSPHSFQDRSLTACLNKLHINQPFLLTTILSTLNKQACCTSSTKQSLIINKF